MDRVLCVSEADAAEVRARGGHAVLAPNGVDDAFFDVTGPGEGALFFGAMDYGPNRRGLERFLAEGWPVVQRALPGARLQVAGPGSERIEGGLGVVDDLPALLATARAVVVPIWEGGGTRLKVLEALAAGRAVVSTPLGAEGIGFEHGRHGVLAASAGGAGRGARGRARRPAGRSVPRAARSPSASAGRTRSPPRRRF